jgi:hypothetical protein
MPSLNKILIYLAVWKRPEITELCFMGIQRMKQHPDYSIQALAVISEDEMIPLCERYGINWVMHPNQPLGKKKNFGLQHAAQFDFDYMMEIGSDDLILNELLTDYLKYIGNRDIFGVVDAAYIDSDGGECRRLISRASTYGAGRMIKRKVLEKMNWKLWADHINKGMDNNSIFSIKHKDFTYYKVEPMAFPGVVDIKSDVNIWKFNYFLGKSYPIENILDKLSPQEAAIIQNYVAVTN